MKKRKLIGLCFILLASCSSKTYQPSLIEKGAKSYALYLKTERNDDPMNLFDVSILNLSNEVGKTIQDKLADKFEPYLKKASIDKEDKGGENDVHRISLSYIIDDCRCFVSVPENRPGSSSFLYRKESKPFSLINDIDFDPECQELVDLLRTTYESSTEYETKKTSSFLGY